MRHLHRRKKSPKEGNYNPKNILHWLHQLSHSNTQHWKLRGLPTKTAADIKIQLLKQLGYVDQNIIKSLIKIHITEQLQTIKQTYPLLRHHCKQLRSHKTKPTKRGVAWKPSRSKPNHNFWLLRQILADSQHEHNKDQHPRTARNH